MNYTLEELHEIGELINSLSINEIDYLEEVLEKKNASKPKVGVLPVSAREKRALDRMKGKGPGWVTSADAYHRFRPKR